MLLRRITSHVKSQDWFAVVVDLLVVVVGVFLAFQVEQWYADRALREKEQTHLAALMDDFQQTKADLVQMLQRYELGEQSAIRLLDLSRQGRIDISLEDFYELLGAAMRLGRFEVNRRTWDVLTAGGEMEVIQNDDLKARIASFFAEVEVVLENYGDAAGKYDMHDQYVIEHFDFLELTRYYHPAELSDITPAARDAPNGPGFMPGRPRLCCLPVLPAPATARSGRAPCPAP